MNEYSILTISLFSLIIAGITLYLTQFRSSQIRNLISAQRLSGLY